MVVKFKNKNIPYTEYKKEDLKYVADRMSLTSVKIDFICDLLINISNEIDKKFYNEDTRSYVLSSDEAKMLVDEYAKYIKIVMNNNIGFTGVTDIDNLINYGRFDNAIYVIEKSEQILGTKLTNYRLNLGLKQKEYQQAIN